jgi:DNA-binding GntR family transcriptional regulator
MENVDFNRAYDYIRQGILSGKLAPGASLMADVLAARIGLSRTPVREALQRLAADGLVTIRSRVGASVRLITTSEYAEICGLRMAMEIFAAGLAARLRTEADLREMQSAHEAANAEIERLIATRKFKPKFYFFSSETLIGEEMRFHFAIAAAARNSLIQRELVRHQLVTRILTFSDVIVDPGQPTPQTLEEGISLIRSTEREHRAIFEAISNGDVAAARTAMECHLQEDTDAILQRLASGESRRIALDLSVSPPPKKRARRARPRRH